MADLELLGQDLQRSVLYRSQFASEPSASYSSASASASSSASSASASPLPVAHQGWRNQAALFYPTSPALNVPFGILNIAPAWFEQGHKVSHPFSASAFSHFHVNLFSCRAPAMIFVPRPFFLAQKTLGQRNGPPDPPKPSAFSTPSSDSYTLLSTMQAWSAWRSSGPGRTSPTMSTPGPLFSLL